MINDHPDARSLVEQALADFKAHVLPLIPREQRLTSLMIANALGIASRELANGTAADQQAADRAGALLASIGETAIAGESAAQTLTRLCAAITAGKLDDIQQTASLRPMLMDLAKARVGISHPKMLA